MSEKQWMVSAGSNPLPHHEDISCERMGCRPVGIIEPERLVANFRLASDEGMQPIDALMFALRSSQLAVA